ncbi:efflux RND transporter permease subunit [Schlesneria paludicola]|uniref:efflux RND transporter permease subunit n=1 Tax=Schlesneria paludicola TaxID=360056 RepID=UPI00029A5039|nr:efflux RND transporter permease subunit [Schlesneria paludicola]
MNISEICIRRPVFTWVLVAIPVVLGMVAYKSLGVDLFPKVDLSAVSISAHLAGASAEEIETTVTKVIEEAVNQVSGIDELRSTTREGMVTVAIQFRLDKDGDVAAQEVRDKISSILNQLPQGMEPPVINRFDLDAAPIMTIGVSGRRDVREVTEIAKHQIQEQLQTVQGVGAVFMSGGRTRAVNVIVNTERLSSYGLSIEDVRQALITQNLEVPGGIVNQSSRELVLRTLGRMQSAAQFNDLIVANRAGYTIRIKDIGTAVDSVEEPRGLSRLDGQNAVSLFVQRQSGTNTVAISDAVQIRLARIKEALPDDVKVEIIQDQSRFIRESMAEVNFHLLLAAVLVSLTILLFIRDWRTTVIATMAIPTSIIPTFLFMHYMGFTLNNITMLALILAIGIVIDDAVVVHENIFRHMEEFGKDAFTASRDGTREIALAVLATSLSLVVIFVPVAFMGGIVGRFFSSFGLTVAFAIVMSLFVSFTLTPMLCAHFLKLEPQESGHAQSKNGAIYSAVDRLYGWALAWSLRHRFITLTICVLVFFSTIPIASRLGVNLVPRDDQSEFQVTYITPEGYTLERSNQVLTEIEGRLAQLPGVVHRFTIIGQNSGAAGKGQGDVTRGSIYFRIKELEERQYSQFEVMGLARAILKDYPDLRTAVSDVSAIGVSGQDSRTFQISIQGPDIDKLAMYSADFMTRLRKIQGLVDVDSTLSLRKPEVQVMIDRDRASDLGIPVQTIANSLNVLVGGQIVSRYKEGTEQYDVWLRADKPFRATPQSLESLTLPSPTAGQVQLSSLASLIEARGPSQIDRFNRQRTVTLLAHPDGISLNDAVQQARAILKELKLPPDYEVTFGGQAKTLGETGYYFMVALILSILFMYLILAAQFESWFHPVSILAALPVTIPFGLLSLLMFRTPMDLYAMFGLFMLIGIVKKNGILQIDKTNELRAHGLERTAAILEANHTRLRPILMTTVMLIAAMIPIALGRGPGAGARASMAKVIIGGQSLSLLLALLVTPVTYAVIDSFVQWVGRVVKRFHQTSRDSVRDPLVPKLPLEGHR